MSSKNRKEIIMKPFNLKQFFLLTLAGIINAVGITMFLSPVNLYDSGITKIDAMGGYSDTKRTVIYFVLNRFQIGRMKNIIHDNDPSAFITITEVADVFKANHN